jgi:hypothetical protein
MMKYERMHLERKRLLNAGTREWLDDGTDLHVASHEAGHVVAGRLMHLNPTSATIDPGIGYDGLTTWSATRQMSGHDLAYAHGVCLMAGNEAERLAGCPGDQGKNDLAQARHFAGLIGQSPAEVDVIVDCARRTARGILKANFGSLLAITSALLTKRTLDRDEIKKLLASNMPDDDDDNDDSLIATDFGDPILARMLDPRRVHYGTLESVL